MVEISTAVSGTGTSPETPSWASRAPGEWLSFHLVHPGPGRAVPGADPNCAFYWAGRYHLHYIYSSDDGYAFAHVSSSDMVHWTWHPTTLTPSTTGHGMWSGTGFITREGRPAIIYHGHRGDEPGTNELAFAEDDDLERWTAPVTIELTRRPERDADAVVSWDPDAWLEGDVYYAVFGSHPLKGNPVTLQRSPDLRSWEYVGPFLAHDLPDAVADTDLSCPNFFPLGRRHMLLCISHNLGCRYYLGEWKDERFVPDFHGRMNWNGSDLFAPESVLTPDGRRVMWAWCRFDDELRQSGIQSLPRELGLPDDGVLRIRPLRELESLRARAISECRIGASREPTPLIPGVEGRSLEITAAFARGATRFGMLVHADPTGLGGVRITVDLEAGTLSLGDVVAPFSDAGEQRITLRVFLDNELVEAFADDRQAMVAWHPSTAENDRVAVFADTPAIVDLSAWTVRPIFEDPDTAG